MLVPLGIAAAVIQSSIYDVPGGYRAVMFDRFSGVKNEVGGILIMLADIVLMITQASPEGTHFLVPWLQRAILYDCRIKPRVREHPASRLTYPLTYITEHINNDRLKRFANGDIDPTCPLPSRCQTFAQNLPKSRNGLRREGPSVHWK